MTDPLEVWKGLWVSYYWSRFTPYNYAEELEWESQWWKLTVDERDEALEFARAYAKDRQEVPND